MSKHNVVQIYMHVLCLIAVVSTVCGREVAAASSSVCAGVKLEIEQSLTLERQAFDAQMKIINGLAGVDISGVDIDVTFTDESNRVVVASSNPNDTNAKFFIQVSSMTGIGNINGSGEVAGETSAEIHWLIIPAAGAGGTSTGMTYSVGARVRYTVDGSESTTEVTPDTIFVQSLPLLTLDYFLPADVYGDEPFTETIESPEPFTLGVRIENVGYGKAERLLIDSQPLIVENTRGLVIGFDTLYSEVQGVKGSDSLAVNVGTLQTNAVKVARWAMACTLSGVFKSFAADFTHDDKLGGKLTSLINAVNTHTLLRDVIVDLPGRDSVKDFLAKDGLAIRAYESERYVTVVPSWSYASTWIQQDVTTNMCTFKLTVPTSNATIYVQKTCEYARDAELVSVVRWDGKRLSEANTWSSHHRQVTNDQLQVEYFFNLFDTQAGGEYFVTYKLKDVGANVAPVLQYIGRKVTSEGQALGFMVRATDPNGPITNMTAMGLPSGATFVTSGASQATFTWTPAVGDYGVHPVRFTVSDGQYTDWEIARIYVGHAGEPLCGGIPCSLANWKIGISNLLSSSSSGNATLVWETTEGITYDVYYGDDPVSVSWTRMGGRVAGSGGLDDATDAALGQDRMKRFYQVVFADETPDTNGVWGMIRRDIRPGYTLVSPPLNTDRKFNGELGAYLAEKLVGDNGGVGDRVGDEIYTLQPSGAWRILYLDADKVWRESNGTASTYELPAGQGFIVARNYSSPARLTFSGAVGNDRSHVYNLVSGWNIIGLSEGKDVSLNDVLGEGVALGGADETESDLLIFQNPDGSWRRLMRVEGWGAPYDGNWFDLSTFLIYTNRLVPGDAYYYYRQPGAGSVDVSF